jgi:hypothetical protein
VVGPFVLPDARPSSKQKAPRGRETRPSKFVLRKQQNEVPPVVKPLCSPTSGPWKIALFPLPLRCTELSGLESVVLVELLGSKNNELG